MLSKNITRLREEKNISKSELARRTGLSTRAIENLELGKVFYPRLDTLQKLSEVFNVTINELIK